tara:strand:- start:707 stop:883 length:177 start_codon:yes stop_codon:yes gene_type:complete
MLELILGFSIIIIINVTFFGWVKDKKQTVLLGIIAVGVALIVYFLAKEAMLGSSEFVI